ncbi:hypothetical protein V6Z12_D05G076100 [Gossypium hirsutum]|uniref:BURP domain-containing protein n=1 Tax=Gossypium hirsutum TaxID=3635 RepID=A0ABM3A330_GOSHI|nr:uncharacterized protein LOC107959295 [Gossypium hirsutum]
MEFRYVPIFAMALVLAVGATRHVALPAEMYWTSVFPNTPMPKALQNLLIPPAAAGNHMKAALANMIKRYKGILIPRYVTAYRIYENAAGNSKQEFGDGNMATNKDVFFFESKLRPGTKMNLKNPKYSKKQSRIVKHQPLKEKRSFALHHWSLSWISVFLSWGKTSSFCQLSWRKKRKTQSLVLVIRG